VQFNNTLAPYTTYVCKTLRYFVNNVAAAQCARFNHSRSGPRVPCKMGFDLSQKGTPWGAS
jgi:hypothetical protein